MAKAGFEPSDCRVSTVGCLNHLAMELVDRLCSSLKSYTTTKIDQNVIEYNIQMCKY